MPTNTKPLRSAISLLAFMALAGCAGSVRTPDKDIGPVPSKRVFVRSFGAAGVASTTRLMFRRDTGFGGGGCDYDIFANDIKVVSLSTGEEFVLPVLPGIYALRMETGDFLCPKHVVSLQTEVAPGQVVRLRLGIGSVPFMRIDGP